MTGSTERCWCDVYSLWSVKAKYSSPARLASDFVDLSSTKKEKNFLNVMFRIIVGLKR